MRAIEGSMTMNERPWVVKLVKGVCSFDFTRAEIDGVTAGEGLIGGLG